MIDQPLDNSAQPGAAAQPSGDRTAQGPKFVSNSEMIAAVLLLVCIGFGWLWVTLALQVILPLAIVGTVARRPDLFSFVTANSRRSLGPPYYLGAFYVANMLAPFAWFKYVEKVGWVRIIELAVAVGIVLFVASIFADATTRRTRNWGGMVFLFVFNVLYGYVTASEANVLLDRSPSSVQEAVVLSKRYIYGRGGGYQLVIRHWGPMDRDEKVWVSGPVYGSARPDGAVCIVLRQGALHVPWYTAQTCPWNGGRVQLGGFLTSPLAAPNPTER